MQCPFCKHEVSEGTAECPYCHYQFAVDAEVLSSDERDSFEGVTIEEDGSTSSDTRRDDNAQYEEERPTRFGQRDEEQQAPSGFQMRTFGGTGCLIWLLSFVFLMIFMFVAAVKLFVAFPLLGVLALIWWLNSSFHWF